MRVIIEAHYIKRHNIDAYLSPYFELSGFEKMLNVFCITILQYDLFSDPSTVCRTSRWRP